MQGMCYVRYSVLNNSWWKIKLHRWKAYEVVSGLEKEKSEMRPSVFA